MPTHSDPADAARAAGEAYANAILAHHALSDRHGRADGRGRSVMGPLLAESRGRLVHALDTFLRDCVALLDAGRDVEAARIATAVLARTAAGPSRREEESRVLEYDAMADQLACGRIEFEEGLKRLRTRERETTGPGP